MLFCSNRSKPRNGQLNITIDNHNIDQVHHFKYLGMTLDCQLTYETHVNNMCNKVSPKTGILSRIRCFIPLSLSKDLYTSLLMPHFIYGNFLLTDINTHLKRQLQVQQNNALRIVKNVYIGYSLPKLFTELNMDTVDIMAKNAACKLVYKAVDNKCPDNVNENFIIHSVDRDLRSDNFLCVDIPKTNTKFGDQNFTVSGGKLWNSILEDIKKITISRCLQI